MKFRKNQVSIRDIASEAGVSTSTVSHVINETRLVSQETRERVLAAIESKQYQPNLAARQLKSGKSGLLGMLIPNSSNPFFSEVVKGFEERCFEYGYSVLLSNCDQTPERQTKSLRLLRSHSIDGLAVLLPQLSDKFVLAMGSANHVPSVALDLAISSDALFVRDNSRKGGEMAVDYLWKKERKRLAIFCGPLGHDRMQERLAGVRIYLEKKGLDLSDSLLFNTTLDFKGGANAAEKLLSYMGSKSSPNGLISFNDAMAVGAMKTFRDNGVQVPQDLAIVGYDDIELAAYCVPSLTTISQDGFRLGTCAADALVKHLREQILNDETLMIEPKLIIRESA